MVPFGKKNKKSSADPTVLDVSDKAFELQVIPRSYKQPVMA